MKSVFPHDPQTRTSLCSAPGAPERDGAKDLMTASMLISLFPLVHDDVYWRGCGVGEDGS
jgi:hypothetical protein